MLKESPFSKVIKKLTACEDMLHSITTLVEEAYSELELYRESNLFLQSQLTEERAKNAKLKSNTLLNE